MEGVGSIPSFCEFLNGKKPNYSLKNFLKHQLAAVFVIYITQLLAEGMVNVY